MNKSFIYVSLAVLLGGVAIFSQIKPSNNETIENKQVVATKQAVETKQVASNTQVSNSTNTSKTIEKKSDEKVTTEVTTKDTENNEQVEAETVKMQPSHFSKVEKIKWISFNEGIKKAKADKKPIFIDFYTDWCTYCKKLDAVTYSDDKVANYMNDKFITIKVNAESPEKVIFRGETYTMRDLALAFGVNSYPYMFFLEDEQNTLGPLPGFVEPDKFYVIASFIGSNAYKTTSIENYTKNFKG